MTNSFLRTSRWAILVVSAWAGSASAGDAAAPAGKEKPPAKNGEESVLTGRELLASCTDKGGTQSEPGRFCMTFVVGLVQTVTQMQMAGESQPLFCIDPNKVSPESVRDTAVKWMQARPERGGEEAYVLMSEALHQAYPCAASGPAEGPAPAPVPANSKI